MSVYKRHFRVTTGALADEAKRIHDLTEQVRLAWIIRRLRFQRRA